MTLRCLLPLAAACIMRAALAAGVPADGLPPYHARPDASGPLSSMGDAVMGPLMDAWLADYLPRQPGAQRGNTWTHFGATGAPYGLANRVADIAPLAAPLDMLAYGIRFRHNSLEQAPVTIQVGTHYRRGEAIPLYLVAHGDPQALRPLEPKALAFIDYALSLQGQQVLAARTEFVPLDAAQAAHERARLHALLPSAVPDGVSAYTPAAQLSGPLRSVGSALPGEWMERAWQAFQQHHPGVRKSGEWRYMGGTSALSGLLAGVSDMAPLSRDLGALEAAQFEQRYGQPGPRSLRIAQSRPKEIRSRALGVFVAQNSPLAHISLATLGALYAGQGHSATALKPLAVAGDAGLIPFLSAQWQARQTAPDVTTLPASAVPEALARNANALVLASLNRFQKLPPGMRQLPVAAQEGDPAFWGSMQDIAARRYALVRPSFVHMLLPPGPVEPAAAGFIRFLLSREGQALAVLEGFGPLSAQENAAQLAALNRLPLRTGPHASRRTPASDPLNPLELSSMGDAAAAPLMQVWLIALRQAQPGLRTGTWVHAGSTATPHGLTNYVAELAPLVGPPEAIDEMTYRVRFRRNGIEKPLLLPVALYRSGGGDARAQAVTIAVHGGGNRPVARAAETFLRHALSFEGQAAAAAVPGFAPLPAGQAQAVLQQLDALYRAPVALPAYRPRRTVSGPIDSVGAAQQGEWMERALAHFQRWHPGVYKGARWLHPGSSAAMSALLADVGDVSPIGREPLPRELQAWQARHGSAAPLTLKLAHGPRVAPSRSSAVAIYVHADNPVPFLTLAQLDAIFSATPRAKAAPLRSWQQLGLRGASADAPPLAIRPYLFAGSNAPASIQRTALRNTGWNPQVQTLALTLAMQRVASEAGAIAMGYFDDPTPGLRLMPIARSAGQPASSGSPQDIASGRYPLVRDVYLLLKRRPANPQTREFIRFLLSREGQELGVLEGYFPLSAQEVRESLGQLER